MQYDDFVGRVHNRAQMASTDEAVAAIRATLQTLGDRLAKGEASDLAAQLPEEIGTYLQLEDEGGERFSLEEFFRRVAERESVDYPDAVYHARVVVEVIGEAITQGEMDDVRAQLPAEYDPLFEAGSTAEMSTP